MQRIVKHLHSRVWSDTVLLLGNIVLLKSLFDYWVIASVCCFFTFLANNYLNAQVNNIKDSILSAGSSYSSGVTEYSDYIPHGFLTVFSYSFNRIIFFVLLVAYLTIQTEFSFERMFSSIDTAAVFFKEILQPEWSLFGEAVSVYAKQTIEIALLGTILAFFTALPLSVMMSRNTSSVIGLNFLYIPLRALVSIIRAIPTFLLGLIFVALVGLGPMPGVLAIYIFSVGIMAKQFSESIEALSDGPAEAVKAAGGTKIHVLIFGYATQGIPLIIAHLFYCLEINIHSATVLGLIGAEGIGLPIHEYITAFAYSEASVFILVVIIMTVLTDYVSNYLRHKII